MDRQLRKELNECLRELEASGDIEACLGRHPERAEDLRPYLEMAASLDAQELSSPSLSDRLEGRQRLLSQIAELNQGKRGAAQMMPFGRRLVPVVATALGAVFLLGGLAGASALPGSPVPGPQNAFFFLQGGDEGDNDAEEALEAEHETQLEALEAECDAAEEQLDAEHEAAEEAFEGTSEEEEALEAQHDAEAEALEAECKTTEEALEDQHEAEEEDLELAQERAECESGGGVVVEEIEEDGDIDIECEHAADDDCDAGEVAVEEVDEDGEVETECAAAEEAAEPEGHEGDQEDDEGEGDEDHHDGDHDGGGEGDEDQHDGDEDED